MQSRSLRLGAAAAALAAFPQAPLRAQETERPEANPELEELRRRIALLESEQADEIDDLHLQLESLERQVAELEARGRETPERNNVFNPSITVFGNFLARIDDVPVHLDDDPAEERVDDRFNLREVEVDFRAAIDPWADGVLIAAYESDLAGETEVTIEEGYVVLKQLPVVDAAPGGLELKLGRFRAGFGRLNPLHLHDLPWPSYPRALGTFLGEEGYVRDGVSGRFFLPSPSDSQVLEATVQVVNGGGLPVAEDQSGSEIAVLARTKYFADLGGGQSLELGVSGWQSDSDHRLYGGDATYTWKPFAASNRRSFLLGGEVYRADVDDPALDDALGFYVGAQYQFTRNLYLGARYDRAEELADSSQVTDTYGAYLSYYTTEFLRLRLGLEHAESDVALLDGRDTALLELNFVFGAHPVHPYWVNR